MMGINLGCNFLIVRHSTCMLKSIFNENVYFFAIINILLQNFYQVIFLFFNLSDLFSVFLNFSLFFFLFLDLTYIQVEITSNLFLFFLPFFPWKNLAECHFTVFNISNVFEHFLKASKGIRSVHINHLCVFNTNFFELKGVFCSIFSIFNHDILLLMI